MNPEIKNEEQRLQKLNHAFSPSAPIKKQIFFAEELIN